MAFFLIVPSVIIVSIFFAHALAKRLGLRIYYTTLVASAVLAFMVDFAATLWSPAVGKGFLLRLGLMILAASFLLLMANRFLIKQQRAEEKNFHEEVKAAYEAEVSKESSPPLASIETFSWEEDPPPPKYNEAVEEPPNEDEPADVEPVKDEEPAPAEEVAEPVAKVKAEEKPQPTEKFPLEKVFEPLSEVKHEEIAPPVEEPEEKFPLEEVFKPLPEVKPEKVEPPPPKPEDLFPLQEVFSPLSTIKLDKLEKLPAEEPDQADEAAEEILETLDDILDKAYNERARGHIWQAIEFYKKALERYRNDEYAPFVAIDLGNIYKEQALYSKAIKIYEEALTLPAVSRNPSIKKEFVTNLEYLRIVRDVLLKYHALSMPFAKLSQEILQEIDNEYQKAHRRI